MTIYYFCPEAFEPIGGVQMMYRHVDMLNQTVSRHRSHECPEAHRANPRHGEAQILDMEKHSTEVKETIRESVEAQRRGLEEQYSRLFDER
jgi:hypothetical protein